MVTADRTPATALPRVGRSAAFVPVEELGGAPCVVVDGARVPGAVLALSHWPRSGTPDSLRADTSAAIVDRYLEAEPQGEVVEAVTNNHFDEDGLLGIWLLLERPPPGAPARRLAVEAAGAGDFGTWSDPWAARVAIAAMAMADRRTTPYPEVGRALATAGDRDPAGALYRLLLPRVGPLLDDPERFALLWREEWARVEADTALLDAGEATIEEEPRADVAVVRGPRALHPMAVHPRTERMRVLGAPDDGTLVLTHRYETWVEYASRPLAPRIDLAPLARALDRDEANPGRWVFEGVEPITPRLYLAAARGAEVPAPSSLTAERIVAGLVEQVERRAA